MKSYQAPMLPSVDYQKIAEEETSLLAFSLIDLECITLHGCSEFLKGLGHLLLVEKLVQGHEKM